jgi:signal transduction histidine kinase
MIFFQKKLCTRFPFAIILLPLLSLLLHSCSNNNITPGISPHFNEVLQHAVLIRDSGNIAGADHYIDSAAHDMSPLSIRDKNELYVFKYNTCTNYTRNFDQALIYVDSLVDFLERNGVPKKIPQLYAEALYRKGDALFEKQSYTDAYRYYYRAKSLLDNTDPCILSNYNYRLGMVFYKQKHFDDAVNSFKLAYEQAARCDSTFEIFYRRQEILDNIGLSFYNNNAFDSAISYYTKDLDYIKQSLPKYADKPEILFNKARAIVYGNLAAAYMAVNNAAKAEDLFKKSIAISSRQGYDVLDGQLTRIKLTKLYFDDNNYTDAYATLQSIKHTLDSLPDRNVEVGWYDLMWQYYDHQAQTKPAFDYLLKYSKLNDSLSEENIKLRGLDIRARLKYLDTQNEINTLEKKSERRKYMMLLALTVSVMVVIILLLILQNLRRSKKNVHILTTLNSHIREQNHRLEEVLTQLELSNKEKDRILRTVAHDIRNPIAAISTITGVLLENTDNYTERQKEYMLLIETACKNALLLSNEILEATNVIRKEKVSKESVQVQDLLKNCIELLRFRAVGKGQKLTLSIAEELDSISVDKEKISRAINNLIINAIKFSPEESEISIAATKQDDRFVLSVTDHGIGIPDDIKDKVFDMFSEAKRQGTAGEKPFGLGLSITRQIVLAHNGKIWFMNNPAGGTTFYISLPL